MVQTKNLLIRPAEASDFEGLMALNNGLGFHLGALPSVARNPGLYRHWLTKTQGVKLLALVDDRIIGQAALTKPRHDDAGRVATLSMGIRADQRGQGFGTLLLKALLREADGPLGLDLVDLTVFSDNLPAIRLYKKCGFVPQQIRLKAILREGALADVEDWVRLRERSPAESLLASFRE